MKKLAVLLLIISFPAVSAAQMTVGIMDYEEAINALPETADLDAEVQAFAQEREQVFMTRYESFIDEITLFSEQVEAGALSVEEESREEVRLTELEEQLISLQNRIQQEIRRKQEELFVPLLNRVDSAIEVIAEQEGLDYVLKKNSNTGDPYVFFASQRAKDITDQVVQYLTQN
ncbi:MAG: OmpH family outer membrane protein [Balneolaceae bacterium]